MGPVHRGPKVTDILPKFLDVKYLTLIDTNSSDHNLMPDEKSYLATFVHWFGRFRYIRLLFGVAPVSEMFQRMRDKIFKELAIVFIIADDVLVVVYDNDGTNHDRKL